MLNWSNIIEGIIIAIFAFIISTAITFIFKKIFMSKKTNTQPEIKSKFELNPFLIFLFLTSFAGIITFFSLIFSWHTIIPLISLYLSIATGILLIITYLVYDNQCPNPKCNKILSKKTVKKETLHEEQRPYTYRDLTIYLYTDGSEKEHRRTGKEKTKMETYRTEKEFYECTSCGHKWDKIRETNLDINNRPKPNIVSTRTKPPSDYS